MATFHMKAFGNRKYKCDSLVSFFFFFIVNYDEGIARESFSFKIILYFSSIVERFYDFYLMWSS